MVWQDLDGLVLSLWGSGKLVAKRMMVAEFYLGSHGVSDFTLIDLPINQGERNNYLENIKDKYRDLGKVTGIVVYERRDVFLRGVESSNLWRFATLLLPECPAIPKKVYFYNLSRSENETRLETGPEVNEFRNILRRENYLASGDY